MKVYIKPFRGCLMFISQRQASEQYTRPFNFKAKLYGFLRHLVKHSSDSESHGLNTQVFRFNYRAAIIIPFAKGRRRLIIKGGKKNKNTLRTPGDSLDAFSGWPMDPEIQKMTRNFLRLRKRENGNEILKVEKPYQSL